MKLYLFFLLSFFSAFLNAMDNSNDSFNRLTPGSEKMIRYSVLSEQKRKSQEFELEDLEKGPSCHVPMASMKVADPQKTTTIIFEDEREIEDEEDYSAWCCRKMVKHSLGAVVCFFVGSVIGATLVSYGLH